DVRLRLPRRWWASPEAPRWLRLRPAARCAAEIALTKLSPARSREKYVAPHTSPQPVGSDAVSPTPVGGTSAVRIGPRSVRKDRPRARSPMPSNSGAAKYTAPRLPRVTARQRTPRAIAVAASDIGS